MNYYTADLHFGHEVALIAFDRPFTSTAAMDEAIIGNWNRKVHSDDHVYICGDLSFYDPGKTKRILKQLNGSKSLVLGNHDELWHDDAERGEYFQSTSCLEEITDGQRRLVLCHYPMLEWPQDRNGSWLIFGHIHNSRYGKSYDQIKNMPYALNAGVDINGFTPVSFAELLQNNISFYSRQDQQYRQWPHVCR